MGAEQSVPGPFWQGESISEDWSNWMSGIPDSTSLTEISIPGTHQSMSLFGGTLLICQTMSLLSQFMAGIRFVDIRCRHFRNSFAIHHGSVYQQANFDDVLNTTIDFLKEHPSETILMSIKPEHYPEECTENFTRTFKRYVSRYGVDLFWLNSTHTPTIGEVRGKVVIINRFVGGDDYGIPWDSFNIKDDWLVNTVLPNDINKKLDGIISHLDEARNSSLYSWFITFSSGVSGGAYPDAVAKQINVHVERYAEKFRKSHDRLGIVALDFPGSTIIRAIFMTNRGARD